MEIRIRRLRAGIPLPRYAHGPEEDAGLDLCAAEMIVLQPGIPALVPTGLAIELPKGFEGQVRPRSGLALRHAITLPNAPGTIDPGYRGEVGVILLNLGKSSYTVQKGDRIAQLVVARYETVEWVESDLGTTDRSDRGFGSSGR